MLKCEDVKMNTLTPNQYYAHQHLHYQFVPENGAVVASIPTDMATQCLTALAYRNKTLDFAQEMPRAFLIYTRIQTAFLYDGWRAIHTWHSITLEEYKIVLDELYVLIYQHSVGK